MYKYSKSVAVIAITLLASGCATDRVTNFEGKKITLNFINTGSAYTSSAWIEKVDGILMARGEVLPFRSAVNRVWPASNYHVDLMLLQPDQSSEIRNEVRLIRQRGPRRGHKPYSRRAYAFASKFSRPPANGSEFQVKIHGDPHDG